MDFKTIPDHSAFTMAGLTKREYFAAIAMQGLLASDVQSSDNPDPWPATTVANLAVEQADALIAALNAPVKSDG